MVRNRMAAFLLLMIVFAQVEAQKNRYMVFFKDKNGSPFSLGNPTEFLSLQAIERRLRHDVPVTEQDLPVSPVYVGQLAETGAEIFFTTRWMNGALVQCDAALIAEVQNLEFVSSVEFVAPGATLVKSGRPRGPGRTRSKAAVTDTQLAMVGIDQMHNDGFKGEGITIAVLDAGFTGVDVAEAFHHLFESNRINTAVSKDFVYNSGSVFQYDDHGTEVFSVIAGLLPGTFSGGAPDANFLLFVTEEVPTEYRVEEYNWLFAAEKADSAGAHIIHSSLGYHDFDGTQFDYLRSHLDGKTAVVTRAAEFAADRGIMVVVSAGNEGNSSWQLVTPPADGESVLAVASVNAEEQRANSSSIGPTADLRIKPDVAAMGVGTSVIESDGGIGKASGTSLAAPVITGLVAGLLQRFPNLTNEEILFAIRHTASHSFNPDRFLGYGIPTYRGIVEYLEKTIPAEVVAVYPNPVTGDSLLVRPLYPDDVDNCSLELIDATGKTLQHTELSFSKVNTIYAHDITPLAAGLYFVRIHIDGRAITFRIVRI